MGVRGFDILWGKDDGYDPTLLHRTKGVFLTGEAYPGRVKHIGATEFPPCDLYRHEKAEDSWFMAAFHVTAGPGAEVVTSVPGRYGRPASLVVMSADAYVKCTVVDAAGYMQQWNRYIDGERHDVSPGEAVAAGLENPVAPVEVVLSDDPVFIKYLVDQGLTSEDTPVLKVLDTEAFQRIRGRHVASQDIPLTVALAAASVTFVDMDGIHQVRVRQA